MVSFLDVCKFRPASTGTGDFVVSAAVQGYQTPAQAGATNGAIYRYRAENTDLSEWEVGYGAYDTGALTLARTTVLYNHLGTTAAVNFTSRPSVGVVALAADLTAVVPTSRGGLGQDASASTGVPVFTAGASAFVATTGAGNILRASAVSGLQYSTRAEAAAATIPTSSTAITILRYATGYPEAPAIYIPGTISGPMAFQEAGGHYWELDLTGGVIDPRWYGAKGDGIADDTSELQAALTAAVGGKNLYIPVGIWGISATLDGGAGNVRVFGEGKARSIIQVLGSSTLDPLLRFTDASDVLIEGIEFYGNSAIVDIGAIHFLVTAGTGSVGNYIVQKNCFRNFRAHYWIRFLTNITATSHTKCMRYVRVLDNDFLSMTGNAYDFTSVSHPSHCLNLQGSIDNNLSYVDDVIIARNFADCANIKGFVACWAGAKNVRISENYILNSGSAGNNDRGCYGIFVYNNHGTGDMTYASQDITIVFNSIIAARSMGVYGALSTRLDVSHNIISAVQDTTAASLPYAAISFGQVVDSKANGNFLVDNYVGLYLTPKSTSVTMEAVGNRINSSVSNAKGITSLCVGSFANKVKVAENTIILSGSGATGISMYSQGAGFEYEKVDIVGNRVTATDTCIVCSDSVGGGIRASALLLEDNHVDGAFATCGIDIPSGVGQTHLHGGSVNLAIAGASALGFRATSHASIHIDGLKIANRSTGTAFAFSAAGANGSMKNVNLIAIARANLPADGSTHMGFVLPSVAATGIGQFIQNLATTSYTPQGAAASQYTIDGWVFSTGTTWYPRRCLTGT